MNAWKVILATLIIFGAGVITGGLLVSYAVHVNQPPPIQANAQQAVTPWQFQNRELLRRIDRELDLTPEQREHIQKMIAESQERTKDLWKPIAGPMNKEKQRLLEEIRKELTPEQRQKFKGLVRPNPAQNRKRFLTNPPPAEMTNPTSTNALPVNP